MVLHVILPDVLLLHGAYAIRHLVVAHTLLHFSHVLHVPGGAAAFPPIAFIVVVFELLIAVVLLPPGGNVILILATVSLYLAELCSFSQPQ
jgi:hypothetical protein